MGYDGGVHVVQVRYGYTVPNPPEREVVDDYAAADFYRLLGPVTIQEPQFPEERRSEHEVTNLALLGHEVAGAVAEGRRGGKPVLIVGSSCHMTPAVLGGLQQAHGADARIGLVWLDAHGDCNTPATSYSQMLGGMPVAVSAGLCWPEWREGSLLRTPLPTDRIVMVDVRNLDDREAVLIHSTDIAIVSVGDGFPGAPLQPAIADLAAKCDLLYLHVDSDILDESHVPNHSTPEPNGPNIEQVLAAIETVMATGKVAAYLVGSVWKDRPGGAVTLASGIALLRGGLEHWARHGTPQIPLR